MAALFTSALGIGREESKDGAVQPVIRDRQEELSIALYSGYM